MQNNFNQPSHLQQQESQGGGFSHFVYLFRTRWYYCIVLAFLFFLFSFVSNLLEIPLYESNSSVEFIRFSIGKSVSNESLKRADVLTDRSTIDQFIALTRTEIFQQALLEEVKKQKIPESSTVGTSIGLRMKLYYVLSKLGLVNFKRAMIEQRGENINWETVTFSNLQTIPDYDSNSIVFKTIGLDPEAALTLNSVVQKAFVVAADRFDNQELDKGIQFYREQIDDTQLRVIDAETSIQQFYKEKPDVVSIVQKQQISQEFNRINSEKLRLQEHIQSNKKLYDYYKSKYANTLSGSSLTSDVINRFKKELVELEYKRAKFMNLGYQPSDPGIERIDSNINRIKKILKANKVQINGKDGSSLTSIQYQDQLSDKMISLKDEIKRDEIRVRELGKQADSLAPKLQKLPRDEIKENVLRRKLEMAQDVLDQLAKKLRLMEIRRAGESSPFRIKSSPSFNGTPVNMPAWKKNIFALLVGFFLGLSIIILRDVFSPVITDRHGFERIGVKYAGRLTDKIKDLVEVFCSLDFFYDDEQEADTPVVLCNSPSNDVTIQDILPLAEYIEDQGESSLIIVVGKAVLPNRFVRNFDLEFAQIYGSTDGGKITILQFEDVETLTSLKESISLLLEDFELKYRFIFMIVEGGMNNLHYLISQKISDKLLIVTEPAKYGPKHFAQLTKGFKNKNEIYGVLHEMVPVELQNINKLKTRIQDRFQERKENKKSKDLNYLDLHSLNDDNDKESA